MRDGEVASFWQRAEGSCQNILQLFAGLRSPLAKDKPKDLRKESLALAEPASHLPPELWW
jgi:hypothetical protein